VKWVRLLLWLADRRWLPSTWRAWCSARAYRLLYELAAAAMAQLVMTLGTALVPVFKQAATAFEGMIEQLKASGWGELLDAERRS